MGIENEVQDLKRKIMTEILYLKHKASIFTRFKKSFYENLNKMERKKQFKFYQSIFLCKCAEINNLYWLCAEKRGHSN